MLGNVPLRTKLPTGKNVSPVLYTKLVDKITTWTIKDGYTEIDTLLSQLTDKNTVSYYQTPVTVAGSVGSLDLLKYFLKDLKLAPQVENKPFSNFILWLCSREEDALRKEILEWLLQTENQAYYEACQATRLHIEAALGTVVPNNNAENDLLTDSAGLTPFDYALLSGTSYYTPEDLEKLYSQVDLEKKYTKGIFAGLTVLSFLSIKSKAPLCVELLKRNPNSKINVNEASTCPHDPLLNASLLFRAIISENLELVSILIERSSVVPNLNMQLQQPESPYKGLNPISELLRKQNFAMLSTITSKVQRRGFQCEIDVNVKTSSNILLSRLIDYPEAFKIIIEHNLSLPQRKIAVDLNAIIPERDGYKGISIAYQGFLLNRLDQLNQLLACDKSITIDLNVRNETISQEHTLFQAIIVSTNRDERLERIIQRGYLNEKAFNDELPEMPKGVFSYSTPLCYLAASLKEENTKFLYFLLDCFPQHFMNLDFVCPRNKETLGWILARNKSWETLTKLLKMPNTIFETAKRKPNMPDSKIWNKSFYELVHHETFGNKEVAKLLDNYLENKNKPVKKVEQPTKSHATAKAVVKEPLVLLENNNNGSPLELLTTALEKTLQNKISFKIEISKNKYNIHFEGDEKLIKNVLILFNTFRGQACQDTKGKTLSNVSYGCIMDLLNNRKLKTKLESLYSGNTISSDNKKETPRATNTPSEKPVINQENWKLSISAAFCKKDLAVTWDETEQCFRFNLYPFIFKTRTNKDEEGQKGKLSYDLKDKALQNLISRVKSHFKKNNYADLQEMEMIETNHKYYAIRIIPKMSNILLPDNIRDDFSEFLRNNYKPLDNRYDQSKKNEKKEKPTPTPKALPDKIVTEQDIKNLFINICSPCCQTEFKFLETKSAINKKGKHRYIFTFNKLGIKTLGLGKLDSTSFFKLLEEVISPHADKFIKVDEEKIAKKEVQITINTTAEGIEVLTHHIVQMREKFNGKYKHAVENLEQPNIEPNVLLTDSSTDSNNNNNSATSKQKQIYCGLTKLASSHLHAHLSAITDNMDLILTTNEDKYTANLHFLFHAQRILDILHAANMNIKGQTTYYDWRLTIRHNFETFNWTELRANLSPLFKMLFKAILEQDKNHNHIQFFSDKGGKISYNISIFALELEKLKIESTKNTQENKKMRNYLFKEDMPSITMSSLPDSFKQIAELMLRAIIGEGDKHDQMNREISNLIAHAGLDMDYDNFIKMLIELLPRNNLAPQ